MTIRKVGKNTMAEFRFRAIISKAHSMGIYFINGVSVMHLNYSEIKWHLALVEAVREGETK